MFRFGVLGVSRFAAPQDDPGHAGGARLDGRRDRVARRRRQPRRRARWASRRRTARTRSCSRIPRSTASTTRCPTTCTFPGRSGRPRPASTCWCEKPIALGAAEARRLIAARDAHGVVICEAAMVRVHPRWLAVRELVRKGKIGELRAFVGTFGYNLPAATTCASTPTWAAACCSTPASTRSP